MKTLNVLVILVLAAFGSAVAQPRYDILIRGGRVLDGSGNPWFANDVAIENGRIVAVGRLDGASADRVIDAEGLYISPGFIDMHSHANSGFDHEERRAKATVNNLMQGITTVVFSEGSAWGQDERIQDKSGQWSSSGIGTNAAMFVGISNQISKIGTTDIPNESFHSHWQKRPWDMIPLLLERSPITHTANARTPVLIMHGKDDPRVSYTQSLELYRWLKIRTEVPVRLVLYEKEGHGNRRRASQLDYALRMHRWFDHFLVRGSKGKPSTQVDYE